MSAVLDPLTQRRARVRAVAAAVLDQAPSLDRFRSNEHALKPSQRRRSSGAGRVTASKPAQFNARRAVARMVLGLQLVALMCALFLPTFRVANIKIAGSQMLNQAAVLNAAGISGQSVFTIDGDTVRNRLLTMPWIRTATVATSLPNRVTISITEWSPTLRTVHGNTNMLLADDGAVVDAGVAQHTALAAIPLLVDSRATTSVPPVNLVQLLDQAVQRYPTAFGVRVAAFEWQADGRLAVWASSGWRAILGHVDTGDQIASLPGKLATLAALKGTLNFPHPNFGYVDLENSAAPAVGGTPGLPANINAALTAPISPLPPPVAPKSSDVAPALQPLVVPSAAATPAPTQASTPKPAPTASPYVFYLPPPSH